MKNVAKYLLWVGILSALAIPAFAETRTISWDPVTTYTDNTPIEAGKTVSYSAYWTTDPGLSLASLHTIGTSLSSTSTTFDPDVQGMTRGGTVYFTAKAVLNTGEESALSPAYAWVVPVVTPPGSLSVSPAGGLSSSGTAGGTFSPSSLSCTLSNPGGTSVNWTAAKTQSWVTLSATAGTLAAGGTATVTVSINSGANILAAGSYSDTVTFTNTTNGTGNTTRPVGLTVNAAVLTSVTVSGPSSVNEGGTGTYTATGTWDNGTTAAISPTWSENSTYATISSGGVLTASAVTSNQSVTVTATYGGRTGTMSVTIVDVPAVLTSVTVSGPSSVNEGGTGTYTATGTWDNGTTAAISPTWSENSAYATISSGGVLTASAVTSNQSVTVTATYGGRTGTMSVTIVDVPAVLTSVAVSGPSSVNEGGTGTYTATGTWDNGTTAAISPTWSVSTSYASISAGGLLTAATVTSNQSVTVTATYGGRTGTMSATIVDVPAVLTSVAVSGPSSVNEGGTGTYTATGTWDNGTTAAISPTWSENSAYATISSGGVLTASAVTSNQSVTVTATYGGRTGTMSVTIVDVPAVLTSVAVSGPSSVNEGGTGTYTATGTWDNGTTAAISPTWSVSTSYASISAGGLLTAATVTSNQSVTVTATYGGRTGTMSVTIVNAAAVLTSVTVSGPSSVNEGGTGTYTATGTWDNGTTAAISPTWSENSAYATISSGGVLTASAVTSNQSVTVTATYGGRTGTMSVTIVDVPAVLTSVAVSGPSSVNEGGTGTYTATGTWDNGTTAAISPTWSVSTSYASISAGGLLTAATVTSNQSVTVTATYGGRTGTMSVTIANVAGPPAVPKNIGISGPISSGATDLWRVNWDPVTTYADDAPLEPGRTVHYSVYWTDDPALSAGSLRHLASSIFATMVDFDPLAYPMVKNQVIYLTVQSILDTGDPSSLAASIEWVVSNTGPAPPAAGKIIIK